ncbi:MAG: Cof-type HAD-IIB family hydrolase [Coriobacteriales bacterium]|nr:Cof-type HAD-IIB family hydrolase [Coriobacteriales bacterium]
MARRPQGVGLLFFDLDDTLVQSGSYVSPRVLKALAAARDAGYILSIASGRPLCIVNKSILESGVMDYGVCANGAMVTRLRDGSILLSQPLACADAMDCHAMLGPFKPAWNAFIGTHAYFEWKGASYMLTGRNGAIARATRQQGSAKGGLRAMLRLVRKGVRYVWGMATHKSNRQVLSILPHLRAARDGVHKMGCTIPNAQRCAQAYELLAADGRFEVVRMGTTELEVTARGVSKGSGARWLMEHVGVDPQDAVAFGDGGNDLPLAEVCGRFVAMGNADEEVKEAASEVCGSVAQDGVALWIENRLAQDAEGSPS